MVHEMIDGTYRQTNLTNESPEVEEGGIDELTPIWNLMDLTPQGRGTFSASLDYGTKVHAIGR
jgi:predicted dithiol-disulfide oxidoreductase (DUF899 family)